MAIPAHVVSEIYQKKIYDWYLRLSRYPHLPGLVCVTIPSPFHSRALDARWNPELRLRRLRPCAPVMRRWSVEQMEYGSFSLYEIIIIP
jgi:hypothetical protein